MSSTLHQRIRGFSAPLRCAVWLLVFTFFASTAIHAQNTPAQLAHERFWLWTFLGRFHPLIVHFPVGLLIFAAFMELFTLSRFNSTLRPAIRLSILTGVIAAIVAAVLGWLLAADGDYGADLLAIHQWTGIATALMGALTFMLLRRTLAKGGRSAAIILYRTVLFITVLGVSVTGHFGASLTHGSDYLASALPGKAPVIAEAVMKMDFASLSADSTTLDAQQQSVIQMQVKSIFAHNCYKCHGAESVKGDLRVDNKDMLFRGGESGPAFVPGRPEESELYRRISLPRGHEDLMPQKAKKLSEKEIDIIRFWILKGAPWPQSDSNKVFRVAALEPRKPALPTATDGFDNPVDLWVNKYFKAKNIRWRPPVSDIIYLRRIYLDITGLMPSPEEIESFEKDPRPDKRAIRVRNLLNKDKAYAVHWMSFWNDALRNDYTGTGYIDGGRSNITNWLYNSLLTNKPYDQFVRELISPGKQSKGFIKGIQWRGVVNASQRTEIQAAQNVAQVFLGLNLKCASCHNSFINNWKLEDSYAFANIFSDSSLEINRCDKPTGKFTKPRMLWEQLGTIDNAAPSIEKQKQLAAIITQKADGRLYRTIVNRFWAQLMGRGLVEPVDIMDNEPWSQDLLDWMASDFTEEGNYDLRKLIFMITTSQAYQLPAVGFKDINKLTAADYQFTGMVVRRMTAEQFSDAVSRIVSPLFPDSLIGFNPNQLDGGVQLRQVKEVRQAENEALLPRAALVVNNKFLTALGRPNRETVSTGRESQANLLQALELTNGEQFNKVILEGANTWLKKYPETKTLVMEIYRRALLRPPTANELKIASEQLGERPSAESVADFLWAVMLLPEFQLIY